METMNQLPAVHVTFELTGRDVHELKWGRCIWCQTSNTETGQPVYVMLKPARAEKKEFTFAPRPPRF